MTKPATVLGRLLALSARVRRPRIHWRVDHETSFENQIGTLSIDARTARLLIEQVGGRGADPSFSPGIRRQLA
jgi:hypothetical protein